MNRLLLILLTVPSIAMGEGNAAQGQKRFEECAGCHSLEAGKNILGPSLHGIFERGAAEVQGFMYSPALKRSKIRWTPQTLDAYIADPQKAVPANRMPYAGLADSAARADLIAYLLKATR